MVEFHADQVGRVLLHQNPLTLEASVQRRLELGLNGEVDVIGRLHQTGDAVGRRPHVMGLPVGGKHDLRLRTGHHQRSVAVGIDERPHAGVE